MSATHFLGSRVLGLCWQSRGLGNPLVHGNSLGSFMQHRLGRQGASQMPRHRAVAVKARGASDAGLSTPPRRHAFLHDFCLCIPYGTIVALCGLAMKLFGGGQTALLVAGSGALEVVLSSLSLKTWRAQQPVAKLFTGLEAGVAGLLTYESYKGLQRGVARIPHAALLLLSALMTLFLVYNLAAGGNPPPKEKPAATIE